MTNGLMALRVAMWGIVLFLCALGMVMIASTTVYSRGPDMDPSFLIKQGIALVAGLVAAWTVSRMGSDMLRQPWLVLLIGAGTLALLAVTPYIGQTRNGATRWISLGPILIQPAELAKVALIVVMAWYLIRVEEKVRVTWNGVLLPLIGFAVLSALVFRTRDLGSVVILAGVLWVMWLYSGANWFYSSLLGILCLPMALYVSVFKEGYRFDRMLAFINNPLSPHNEWAYQLRHSIIALGSGGNHGQGLGTGSFSQRGFVPERHTDFIFSVIGEELGYWGTVGCAFAYLLLLVIGLMVAARTRDLHQRLLVIGAVVLLVVQAFANMMVVTGLIPTKGLTLPFVSYGGSSLFVCLVAVGIIDAVVRQLTRSQPVVEASTTRIGAAVVSHRSAALARSWS